MKCSGCTFTHTRVTALPAKCCAAGEQQPACNSSAFHGQRETVAVGQGGKRTGGGGMQSSAVRFVGEVRRSRGGPQLLHTYCWIIERRCCRVRWSGERVVILSPVLRCVQSRGKWSVTASPRNHTTTPAVYFPHHSPPCCSGGRVTKPLRARTYRHTPPFLLFGESVECW